MINPDWDHSKKNYDTVFRALIIACVITCITIFFIKTQPAKNILIGLAAALLFGGILQFLLYKVKPGAFKNKSPEPDEKS